MHSLSNGILAGPAKTSLPVSVNYLLYLNIHHLFLILILIFHFQFVWPNLLQRLFGALGPLTRWASVYTCSVMRLMLQYSNKQMSSKWKKQSNSSIPFYYPRFPKINGFFYGPFQFENRLKISPMCSRQTRIIIIIQMEHRLLWLTVHRTVQTLWRRANIRLALQKTKQIPLKQQQYPIEVASWKWLQQRAITQNESVAYILIGTYAMLRNRNRSEKKKEKRTNW